MTSDSNALVVRAVTVRLPWAAAIGAGVKIVENRGRPVADKHLGQLVGIHAGAAWSKDGGQDPRIRQWWWGATWAGRAPLDATDFTYMFRRVISVGRLVDCHEAQQPTNPILVAEGATCCWPWGQRWHGEHSKPAWHLVFDEIVALDEPVGPVAGQLAVPWTLPGPVADRVSAEYQGSRG